MRFDELNDDNYMMFAIKHYENPQAVTQEDFYEDLKKFKYIKSCLLYTSPSPRDMRRSRMPSSA